MATHRRFDRTARLLGDEGVARLASATVTVFGVGGVGSFAAEGLVRSGVGRVILVDYDRICVTNVNRQLHAMKGTLGKPKVMVMADRLRAINPDAEVEPRPEFYGPATSARLLTPEPDVVIDAIDNVTAKMHLIATCVRERLRLVSCMGAAGRLDPTAVRVVDLSETRICPFARDLRKSLRKKHGLDCTQPTGVRAVYSEEAPHAPHELAYDDGGFSCVCPGGDNGVNDCEHKHRVEGSVAFVPSVFGMAAASTAVKLLLGLAIVAAVACGDDGGSGPPVDAGLPPSCTASTLTIDEFFRCRSQLTCTLLADCFAADASVFDCDRVEHPILGFGEHGRASIEEAIAGGRARWDETQAAACLADLASRGCGAIKYPDGERLACSGVVGLVADDFPCQSRFECANVGAFCTTGLGGCPQTCFGPAERGQPCFDRPCREGDRCVIEFSEEFEGQRCLSGDVGAKCNFATDCDPGLYCRGGSFDQDARGTCEPSQAAGGPCLTDRDCRDPLVCLDEIGTTPGVCHDVAVPGTSCDGNESLLCFGNQYCDPAGALPDFCRRAPRAGDFCGEVNGITAFCGPDLACDGVRCQPLRRRNEPCRAFQPGTTFACARGFFCDAEVTGAPNGRCRPLLPVGDQCTDSQHCADNNVCQAGVCAEPFSCAP